MGAERLVLTHHPKGSVFKSSARRCARVCVTFAQKPTMHRFATLKCRALSLAAPLLLVGSVPTVQAQQLSEQLDSIAGARVRVVTSNATRYTVVGTVGHVAANTLFLTRDGNLHASVPLPSIEVIDRSRGRGRAARIGGGIGAVTGAALGLFATYVGDRPAPSPGRHVAEVGAFTLVGGLTFGGIGAAVGESWVQIYPAR